MNAEMERMPPPEAEQEKAGLENIPDAGSHAAPEPKTEEPMTAEPEAGASESPETALSENAREQKENEEKEFDPVAEISRIQENVAHNEEEINRLASALEADKANIARLQEELGLTGGDAGERIRREEEALEKLRERQEELEREREEMEAAEELNNVLESLGALPKNELRIIIETGRDAQGQELKGPGGRPVNPDVAKRLGKLAEDGVKKITKAALKIVVGIVKGVVKAIFETVREEAQAA